MLGALFIMRMSAISDLAAASEAHAKTAVGISRISRLKAEWDNNAAVKTRVNNLFASEAVRKLGSVQTTQTGLKIELRELDTQTFTQIMRQLLETAVAIKTLDIKRKSDESVDLALEIVW